MIILDTAVQDKNKQLSGKNLKQDLQMWHGVKGILEQLAVTGQKKKALQVMQIYFKTNNNRQIVNSKQY